MKKHKIKKVILELLLGEKDILEMLSGMEILSLEEIERCEKLIENAEKKLNRLQAE